MCFLFFYVCFRFKKKKKKICECCVSVGGGKDMYGLGVALKRETFCFSFTLSVGWCCRSRWRNWISVCLAASGWSTTACCIIIVCCPSPPPLTLNTTRRREWREERQREGEWMNHWMNCIVCLAMLVLRRPWVCQCPLLKLLSLQSQLGCIFFLKSSLWWSTLSFSAWQLSLCVLCVMQLAW